MRNPFNMINGLRLELRLDLHHFGLGLFKGYESVSVLVFPFVLRLSWGY